MCETRGVTPPILKQGTRWGWVVNFSGRGVGLTDNLHSAQRFKNEWSYKLFSPIRLHGAHKASLLDQYEGNCETDLKAKQRRLVTTIEREMGVIQPKWELWVLLQYIYGNGTWL
jgi:hypothetical protein